MADEENSKWRRFTRLRTDRKTLKRSARKMESATIKHAHTFIVGRWDNVRDVRRHALGWLILVAVLIALSAIQVMLYQRSFTREAAVSGGTYAEGVIGALDNINPLFASNSAERSASRLLFASLLSYDPEGNLRGELASTWTRQDDNKTYVITLRDGLRWHDGAPITADDVVYTINLMKNPRAGSELYSSWAGVGVQKQSDLVVTMTLPAAYAPFPHALTFGVLPKHLLESTPPAQIRESAFNRQPIGSGPFKFRNIQQIDPDEKRAVLHMVANTEYYRGAPKLERFQLHTYKDHDDLRQGYLSNEINAATDLTAGDVAQISKERASTRVAEVGLYDGVYALFRNDSAILQDKAVRAALRVGVNRAAIIQALNGYAQPLEGPLLDEHYASLANLKQPKYDQKAAEIALDAAGWKRAATGEIRQKDGQPLQLSVVTPRSGDYPRVLEKIAQQWRALGVDVKTELVDPATIQRDVLVPRTYDVLIYELAIGADANVYAYWHSSQATARGLNLANYRSGSSDDALASAQERAEPELRASKYYAFTQTWLNDVPAVALYEPLLHYVSTPTSRSLTSPIHLADSVTRYRGVEYWTIDRSSVYDTP